MNPKYLELELYEKAIAAFYAAIDALQAANKAAIDAKAQALANFENSVTQEHFSWAITMLNNTIKNSQKAMEMTETKIFTLEQISQWRRYEKVRAGGRWNIFSPQARSATGMTSDQYVFVINNYAALKVAAAAPAKPVFPPNQLLSEGAVRMETKPAPRP